MTIGYSLLQQIIEEMYQTDVIVEDNHQEKELLGLLPIIDK